MAIYLNEYSSSPRAATSNSVAAETDKIRFNNIQSCVGVVVHDLSHARMVGVHLTTFDTFKADIMKGVVSKINEFTGGGKNKIYLVYSASNHANSNLFTALRPIATQIFACNVPAEGKKGADVDVNVKLEGGVVKIWMRAHADFVKNPDGSSPMKEKYVDNPALRKEAIAKGKPVYQTDKTDKDWMQVPAMPI